MERLRHDVAWSTTLRILEILNLLAEEKCEAFPMVYERIKAGLLAYDKETKDLLRRLRPL
jgi:hypothetical protein